MNIRPLLPSDAAEIARLWYAGTLESARSDPRFVPRLSVTDCALELARELSAGELMGWGIPSPDGAQLLAYLTAEVVPQSATWEQGAHLYVLDVDVQADHRRRGMASALVAQAIAQATALGITRVELSWLANDARADAVWTRLGFRPHLHRGFLEGPPGLRAGLPAEADVDAATTEAPAARAEPAKPSMPPRQVVGAWVEAFNRADANALSDFYTDDATNHQVAEEPVHGRQAIRDMFAAQFAAATMVCMIENLFEQGEWAILEWRDPLGLRGCGFFHVVGGRIAFQRGYWDKISFLRAQGLPLPKA